MESIGKYLFFLFSFISVEGKSLLLTSDVNNANGIPLNRDGNYQDKKPSSQKILINITKKYDYLELSKTPELSKNGIFKKYFKNNVSSNLSGVQKFNASDQLQSRFLDFFEVVEFEHTACHPNTGLDGTCLHEYDCQKINGTSMGSCADGYGICCVILLECDTRSSASVGWFTNHNYPGPSTDRLSCVLTLDKISDVKQLRLDFMKFEMLPPTAGTCEHDQFIVTGQNLNNLIPILCGINSGQHLYIEVSEAVDPITLSFQTISYENRVFAIKITQISEFDVLSAPTGCLQYYKADQGYIESFNYRDTTEIGITRAPSYLNNLNYVMCIERTANSCSVTYYNAGGMEIVNYGTDGFPVTQPGEAGVEIFDCPSDWILISDLRFCGERLNDLSFIEDFSLDAPVTDNGTGPIVVRFRSDKYYTGRGFRLHYRQNKCMRTMMFQNN